MSSQTDDEENDPPRGLAKIPDKYELLRIQVTEQGQAIGLLQTQVEALREAQAKILEYHEFHLKELKKTYAKLATVLEDTGPEERRDEVIADPTTGPSRTPR